MVCQGSNWKIHSDAHLGARALVQGNTAVSGILNQLTDGLPLTEAQQRQLEIWTLQDHARARAFGISQDNVAAVVQRRSRLLPVIYPIVQEWQHRYPLQSPLESLWDLWLPLALQLIAYRQRLNRPLIQGIVGGQGTGKSTLGAILKSILDHLGYATLSLSLDDLYKTYPERQHLRQQDPRLIWRGPPGTHDVQLGIRLLDELRHPTRSGPIAVPRFDKFAHQGAGDRTTPEIVQAIEIVLFEGWFVGVQPVDPAVFATAPPPILTEADRAFAQDMNQQLQGYLPLWQRLDRLILLCPLDYRLSQKWRRQAESQAIAAGRSGMSDTEVSEFVTYFWQALHPQLFIAPLAQNPQKVDLVIQINPDHTPAAVYQPQVQVNTSNYH